jgi:hypothetical protein
MTGIKKKNLNIAAATVLINGAKLKNTEYCYINGQILEVGKEFSCLGVKLESSREMEETKHIKVKGIQRLKAK